MTNWTTTALIVVDLQNDFVHPDGAYARGGQKSADIAALPARVKPVADALRAKGGIVVSTHFTLVPGRGGEPIISPHLKQLRPFLRKGDFVPGSWGHDILAELAPVDVKVEKVAYSAFYMSRLEFVLRKLGIERVIMSGIVTNGGVLATAQDAHVRDFKVWMLSDGCAAFSRETHEATLRTLASIGRQSTCAQAAAEIAG